MFNFFGKKKTTEEYCKEGLSYIESKNYQKAVSSYNEAIKLNTDATKELDLYFSRGIAHFLSNNYLSAISDLDQSLSLNSKFTTETYKLLHPRAYCKSQVGDLKGSIDDYTELLSICPSNDAYLSERAKSKEALEDYLGAIHDYTAASVINPHNIYHLYNRGCCKELLGDQAGAIEDYRQYIELYSPEQHSSNEIFLLTLAVCKVHVGDLKGAIEVLDEAIQINPNNAEAHLLMGSYKVASSNVFEAKKCLELAKELYLKNGNTEGYQKALELQGNLKI